MMDIAFEEPQLRIVLHNGDVLHAPVHGVKCMSACACNLPADAPEWDLSGLLVDGQPVSLSIVKAWLGAVYKQLGEEQYWLALDTTSQEMEGLYQLLRFADAVGSRQCVLQACLAHVDELLLNVSCDNRRITVMADGRVYCYHGRLELVQHNPVEGEFKVITFSNVEAADAARKALTTQLEALLWLAHKMQLAPLISSLHNFIHSSVAVRNGLLRGCLNEVFTDRVKEAALGTAHSSTAQQWVNNIVAQPAAITGMDRLYEAQLLEPVNEDEDACPVWQFRARLCRPYLGLSAGTEVDVRLDLDNGMLHIGEVTLFTQLLVGPSVHGPEDQDELMGG